MVILPSAYLPSVAYFKVLISGDYIIDIGEHFVKRSERNRAQIMTANGVMPLSVNVRNANRPRTPMATMEIDYSKRWQHQHWIAIISAYKSSPYFDYYADSLEVFYKTEYQHLTEYNTALTKLILRLLQQSESLNISPSYITASPQDIDLRAKGALLPNASFKPYIQVFADREPFAPNLSILDLLLCEGPNALSYLL